MQKIFGCMAFCVFCVYLFIEIQKGAWYNLSVLREAELKEECK